MNAVGRVSRGLLLVAAAALAACGGSGAGTDGGGSAGGGGGSGSASLYANQCAPSNVLARNASGNLLSGYRSGSLETERNWTRAYMTDVYLWYREMPQPDPTLPAFNVSPAEVALDNWFEALKTPAITATGRRKDAFSFTYPTAEWQALSQSGIVGGYGFELVLLAATPPRQARVAYVTAGTPAATAGIGRGDTLLAVTTGGRTIDFVSAATQDDIDALNTAIYRPASGASVGFRFRSPGGITRDVTLVATQVTTSPVLVSTVLTQGATKVGYLAFNDFVLPGEGQLKTTFENFRDQGIGDLVLDLRYNGGGYVYIASQLAYMIAPPARTGGRVFERYLYNDKRGSDTNSPANRQEFMSVASGLAGSGTTVNASLPNLNLSRVYVLTSAGTCSASESVINGLRGVDVEVVLVGGATCGKPYGFVAKDNCGLSYFPIEFQGVNDKAFGDFADGFAPTCVAADDFDSALGSPTEGMLAIALGHRAGGGCAAVASRKDTDAASAASADGAAAAGANGLVVRPPVRAGKFLNPEPANP